MHNITRLTICLLLGAMLFASCRKDDDELLNPNRRYNVSTYAQQFEVIWNGINNSYVFWDRDTVDWDAKYTQYQPKFAALDGQKNVSDSVFTQLWREVVGSLLDHHFYVRVENFRTGNMINIGGSAREVKKRADYQTTNRDSLYALLASNDKLLGPTLRVNTAGCNIRSCQLQTSNGRKIAYLSIAGFDIFNNSLRFKEYYNAQSYTLRENTDAAWIPLMQFYGSEWMNSAYGNICKGGLNFTGYTGWINDDDVNGIIIDVRGNGGGDASNLTPLIGALLQSDLHYGYSRTKDGLGRLDYSPWSRFDLRMFATHMASPKPIVVLADASSASCSELTTQTIHSLPNGTFVGKRTCGATCPLLPYDFNQLLSGCFGQKDCTKDSDINYYVYTSNFDIVTCDYTSLEGIGVTPDVDCAFYNDGGKDSQLEKALEILSR